MKNNTRMEMIGGFVALSLLMGCGLKAGEPNAATSKANQSSVVTNENGSVTRTFTESSVTTNGNLVTEHRRETRTNTDVNGNVLETSTSEYAQSYSVGDSGATPLAVRANAAKENSEKKDSSLDTSSFLGLKFGEVFESTNFVQSAEDVSLLCTKFVPAKTLAGFDDYYVYVTPKTHKIVRVCAAAREAIEPGARWRRHYLIEALEKRYGTWARLCSFSRPYYAFDIAPGRYATICLAGASDSYETVLAAWDDQVGKLAVEEREAIREEARKTAAENRRRRVDDAASAF